MPTYPASINHKPDLTAFRVLEAYAPPVMTEFEDGPMLARKRHLGRRAKLGYRLPFRTAAEFNVFRAFVENDLQNGTLRFTMPVWHPSTETYVDRTVQIDRGLYTADPWGLGFTASFTLIVYDW